ncbi:MAG: hypothetical protein AAF800_02000 [Planctomycetota bacterium]
MPGQTGETTAPRPVMPAGVGRSVRPGVCLWLLCVAVGCSAPRGEVSPVPGPLGETLEALLARLADEAPLPASDRPVAIALHRVELQDPDPPEGFPDGEVVARRLHDFLEREPRVHAVRVTPFDGTPFLLGGGDPPAMTLNFELFRLLDLPQVPDQAFYLARLWVFDLAERRLQWEGVGGPFAWPGPPDRP